MRFMGNHHRSSKITCGWKVEDYLLNYVIFVKIHDESHKMNKKKLYKFLDFCKIDRSHGCPADTNKLFCEFINTERVKLILSSPEFIVAWAPPPKSKCYLEHIPLFT